MRPITASRPPPRAPAAVTLQAAAVAPESESEEETESESESEDEPVMLKPVFVSKYVFFLLTQAQPSRGASSLARYHGPACDRCG